ncbi:MAG: alginate lyase family protein [Gemmatimonas sp.]
MAAGLVSGLLMWDGAAVSAATVQPPFDLNARHAVARDLPAPRAVAARCGAPPVPVVRLDMDGFYADSASSVVDAHRMAAYREAVKAIDAFESGVARSSDRYVRGGDVADASCTLEWLERWARAGAMLDAATSQGGYVRKWGLAAVASAYLKVGDAQIDRAALGGVREWIGRWAHLVRDEYDAKPAQTSHRNNHLYWAAWSVGLAAAALDERALLDWSLGKARIGIAEIDRDGFLPLEMARKARALHYHVFAAAPLVLTAELAAANGVDLYAERGGALHRLVAATVAGLEDPAPFAAVAGARQEVSGLISGGNIGWLEAYVARFPDRAASQAAARLLRPLRPAFHRWYGGDATLLYGAETLP